MAKITLNDPSTFVNDATAVAAEAANNAAIENAFENTLSRDGTSPNQMLASLDMNSNRILNLPTPVSDTEPARLVDVRDGITGPAGPAAWAAPVAWTTATAYTATSPASVVTQSGETYVCLVSHTSGTFATDLAASKWIKVAAKGADGVNGAVSVSGTPTVGQFGVWTNATTVKGVGITGLVKGNGASDPTAAVAGTDYLAPPSGTSVLKANSGGALANAVAGTDFVKPDTATSFSAHQYFGLSTLTDAANISWTVSSGQKAKVTLGGNRTMNAVTGAVEGATYFLWVIQDATGSRTLSWTTTGAGSFDFGTAGAPTLTTTASKADLLTFEAISIGGTLKLRYTGIARGFT